MKPQRNPTRKVPHRPHPRRTSTVPFPARRGAPGTQREKECEGLGLHPSSVWRCRDQRRGSGRSRRPRSAWRRSSGRGRGAGPRERPGRAAEQEPRAAPLPGRLAPRGRRRGGGEGGPAACWGSSAPASRAALGRAPSPGVPGAEWRLTGKARIRILVSFRLPVPLLRFDMVLVPSPAAASGRTPRRRCHI